MVRIAALDLGTNTFRLLVAEVDAGLRLRPIKKAQIITRLGGDFDILTSSLAPEAVERSLAALQGFADILDDVPVDFVNARATEIVRKARNGREFLDSAARLLGVKVETLPPEKEAILAWKGIMAYNPPVDGPFVTLDIGGGSTELVFAESEGPVAWVSMPVGVVDLSERVLSEADPPSAESIKRCEKEIRDQLNIARGKLGCPQMVDVVIGTGGTATSLAAIDLGLDEYDEDAVQNHRLSIDVIGELQSRLAALSFKERGAIFPLGGGREDVIIPGAIVTRITMEIFGTRQMLVSDAGLLEGLVLTGASDTERR